MLCMMLLCSFWTMSAQAGSVKKVCSYIQKKTVIKRDITGDGKTDRIAIIPKKDKYNYVTRVQVYINGKKALDQGTDCMAYGLTVNYIYMTKSRVFLQIYTHGDSGYTGYNGIFRSNKKGTKLTCVLDLDEFPIDGGKAVSATSKEIKIQFSEQPSETGWVHWNFTYKYTGSKFKLKSNTASVKSSLSYDNGDGYASYFKQSKFKAQQPLTFYKKTDLKKVSFTAKTGDVLKLKKVKIINTNMYLQFQKGIKTGWQIVRKNFNWFYGVTSRLAG